MSKYLKFKDLGNKEFSSESESRSVREPVQNIQPTERTQANNYIPQSHTSTQKVPEQKFGKIVKLQKIKSVDDKKKIIESNDIVVIDVYGKWCGPCKQAKPEFKKIALKYKNSNVFFVKENVDDNFSTDIAGVPCFQFFVHGKPSGVIMGADMKSVENKIQSYF